MPVATLLTLLDDLSVVLDDVWVMTKLSTKKTAGVLGDDLALNAEQAVGLQPERELPMIFAVARGSARNKAGLIPLALLLRSLAPWAIQPLLMLGGAFLCYEGVEKLLHKTQTPHGGEAHPQEEARRIVGAVRTDLILSAEILAITLGMVAHFDLLRVFLVLVSISVLMTVGVYGLVAVIVKLDDLGLALQQRPSRWKRALGRGILALAPKFLKFLSWAGTLAIFCVGGGIVAHAIAPLHHLLASLSGLAALGAEGVVGLLVGILVVLLSKIGSTLGTRR